MPQTTNYNGIAIQNSTGAPGLVEVTNNDANTTATSANLRNTSGAGVQVVSLPGMWSSAHTPATTVQAAAGIMVPASPFSRYVCTGLRFSLSGGASAVSAAAPLLAVLRDGHSSLAAPTLAAPTATTGGALPAGTINVQLSGVTASGVETIASATQTATTTVSNNAVTTVVPVAGGIYVTYNVYYQLSTDSNWNVVTGQVGQTTKLTAYTPNGGFTPGTSAGTVLWAAYMNITAAAAASSYAGLETTAIVCPTAGHPLTAEFTTVVGTNGYESVSITGYTIS